jgi:type I restriction enzyme R subunit
MIKNINLVAQNSQSTVVAEFTPSPRKAEHYQSEDALEKEFIKQLENQAYEYLVIHKEEDLITNLRKQLERLNNYTFSETERTELYTKNIASSTASIEDKTTTIQEDHIKILKLED